MIFSKLVGFFKSVFESDPDEAMVPPNITPEKLRKTIQLKQIAMLKHQSSAMTLTRLLLCMIFALVCWDSAGGWLLGLWVAFMVMHSLAGMKSAEDFFNSPEPDKELDFWKNRSLQMVFVSGLSLGFAGFCFMIPGAPLEQMILVALIFAMAFAGGTLYACWPPAFWVFMPTVLLPVVFKIILIYKIPYLISAVWLLLLAMILLYFSRRLSTIAVTSIIKDLEREYLMEQLVRQRQSAELAREAAEMAIVSKTRFFAAANHDLRQPLQAMGIFISLLDSQATSATKQLVENLSKACSTVSTLVDQILILSKLDSGTIKVNPTRFNIEDLFSELEAEFMPLAKSKNNVLEVIQTPAMISSDYQLLARVIRNLLGNAIRYTKDGNILLRAKLTKKHSLVITVSDTGAGIDPEEQKNIFKEYFRGKSGYEAREGYGLGLSIVQKIVDLLGYKISLHSRKGIGSIFRLDIPLAHDFVQLNILRKVSPVKVLTSLKGKRILLIEDDPLIRSSLLALLEGWGASVVVAEFFDAQLAADMVTAQPIDLILTDFNLGPGHLTGLQSIFRIRSAVGYKIPAIVMTAMARETVMRQYEEETEGLDFSEAGSNLTDLPAILQKPVSPAEINRVICRLLKENE